MPEAAVGDGGPATSEPELSAEVAARRKGLRTGFTTGTCASAAAKAAASGLVTGAVPGSVEIGLPGGRRVSFAVEGAGPVPPGSPVTAAVVKDAGDDPDCTDGARLTAEVRWRDPAGAGAGTDGRTVLAAGPGVGTVTLLGLGLAVGAPAINPVPRRMILAALAEVDGVEGIEGAEDVEGVAGEPATTGRRPVVVTFSVPGGETMATKTTNARLGIVGGISILGTTGIVRPFSTAAYRASVVQQVDVAAAQGARSMVLCTGSRSEKAAFDLFPGIDRVRVVEVGDFSGIALRRCATAGMTAVTVVAMAGKIAKLAAGVMMTHFHRSKVDTDLLADVARRAGAPAGVVAAATATTTARHFYDACRAAGALRPLEDLCRRAAAACRSHAGGKLVVDVVMVDFEGEEVVARG
ncbi:MAG: cobalt-precorrin-5B (C(1))-methyltransferase [Acidimicrobiales bacterium]